MIARAALLLAVLSSSVATPARAQARDPLAELINAYRAAPRVCEGRAMAPAGPLTPQPALARVQLGTGTFLEIALEQIGYPVAQAEAVYMSGPADARAAMALLESRYCRTLLSAQWSAVGASRNGDNWQIVFAQPAAPPLATRLPDVQQVQQVMLGAVNAARRSGRQCGERYFPAAPALSWNASLAAAALAHSADMARQRYFNHTGKDGRVVGERARQAGYQWRLIGENIAAGQETAEEAVAGWLDSPGHCANIMQGGFTEMGAAFGFSSGRTLPRMYWTQVFGMPR